MGVSLSEKASEIVSEMLSELVSSWFCLGTGHMWNIWQGLLSGEIRNDNPETSYRKM